MLPVLFSIGPISISSFGFFLSLGFLAGAFLVWRLSRAWDFDEEKILDLVLLSFFGGLLGGRIYFVATNFDSFGVDAYKILFFTKYPGLSLWGGFLGGFLTLYIFSKKLKVEFLKVADIIAVGFLSGLILGDIGCFLSACGVGVTSSFLSVDQIGFIGKRFPTQILEALILSFVSIKLYYMAKKFHFPGKILSLCFIWLGIVRLFTDFLREEKGVERLFAPILFISGVLIFYRLAKKDIRKALLQNLNEYWYNTRINLSWNWKMKGVKLLRRFNVKSTPKNSNNN